MNYPALAFWALIALSLTARPSIVLVLLLSSMPFASLALLPPEVAAGMSILPQMMFGVILILKVLIPQVFPLSPALLSILRFRRLGYLVGFLLVGATATVIMPRLFQGEVVIAPMREAWAADLLSPIQSNFTQLGYVTLSVMTTFAVALIAGEPEFVDMLLAGVLAGGAVCVATGLIDIVAAATGMESLLEPFRNAGYAFLTNSEVAGVRRVVGLTPEASAYGAICVQFAAAVVLLRNLYPEGRWRNLATVLALALLVLSILSTSSTAYAGLALLALAYGVNGLRRAFLPTPIGQGGLVSEVFAAMILIAVLLIVVLVRSDLFDPLLNVINETILDKPLSSSFYERSHWNSIAWNAVTSTWGLGVGFGSTRTSNWFIAVISSTGALGAALMGMYLIQFFLTRPTRRTPMLVEFQPALKLSVLPALAMAALAAPGPDFGPWIAVVLGAVAGASGLTPTPVRHGVLGVFDRSLSRPSHKRWAARARAFGKG